MNSQLSKSTRFYRKLHKWVAVPLFLFMFIIGSTGLLLGWKKQTTLLPKTEKGTSLKGSDWIKLDSLKYIAENYAQNTLKADNEIDRIDIRPKKGIAKIVFSKHFTELQLDISTGKIVSVATRKSDFIEKIHDGSILDFVFDIQNDALKLIYTTLCSLGLILLSFSGFWLWYNPQRIRNNKKNQPK